MTSSRSSKILFGAVTTMLTTSVLVAPPAHANRVTDDILAALASVRATTGCPPLQVTWNATKAAEHANTYAVAGQSFHKGEERTIVNPESVFEAVGPPVGNAVMIRSWTYTGHGNGEAVDTAVHDAAGYTSDCSRTIVGVSHTIDDDYNYMVVALAGPVKPAADKPKDENKIEVNDRAKIPDGIELRPTTVTYSLKALGGSPTVAVPPLASINLTYVGDDGKQITQNNVTAGPGFSWTKTVKTNAAPSLTVSANSPGLAGLTLECKVASDSLTQPVNGPSPDKSGTIAFTGGLSPVAAKSCG